MRRDHDSVALGTPEAKAEGSGASSSKRELCWAYSAHFPRSAPLGHSPQRCEQLCSIELARHGSNVAAAGALLSAESRSSVASLTSTQRLRRAPQRPRRRLRKRLIAERRSRARSSSARRASSAGQQSEGRAITGGFRKSREQRGSRGSTLASARSTRDFDLPIISS
jgi:hypothetical protein